MVKNFDRPKVITNCVADNYHVSGERIIEFTFPDGSGGLIQFCTVNEENRVVVYNHDKQIYVIIGKNA